MTDFFKRLLNQPEPPAAPDVPPAEMAAYLRSLDDRQWGRYAFSREPLEGKFTPQQKDAYTAATPAGGGQVLFAQFVQPDEITIFTDCLDKAETLGGLLPARAKLQSIILAHELFHAVEEANPDIYTRTEKIELWRKPFSNKSCIVCLSEIAAMAFAKQLLGLDFNPYALDVLLVYPYDAQAACGLYAEICDLMKEE